MTVPRLTILRLLALIAIMAVSITPLVIALKSRREARLMRLARNYQKKADNYRTEEQWAYAKASSPNFLAKYLKTNPSNPGEVPERERLVTTEQYEEAVAREVIYRRKGDYAAKMRKKYEWAKDHPWETVVPDPPAPPWPPQIGLSP